MNLHRFLIIDSLLLDIAGVAVLFAGDTGLGLALIVAGAIAFLTGRARRRHVQASIT